MSLPRVVGGTGNNRGMRQNKRQPRPANQRPQAHDPGEHTVGSSPSQGSGATWRDPTDHERLQPRALDRQFRHLIERLFEFGWTPLDLFEALRRKVSVAAVGLVLDMAAFATAEHPARLVDPRWQAQLEQFDARVPPPGSSPSLEWARRQK